MPDYTSWTKLFGGAGVPNPSKAQKLPEVAGYLPAPKQARFVSGAERAAESLAESVKAESLKNSLLRGGAKPAELEYAGIDDFIASNVGKKIAKADVLAHLKAKGPLAQLQQVDQKHIGDTPPSSGNRLVDMWNELPVGTEITQEMLEAARKGKPTKATVAAHPVGTFDEEGAFPKTVYHPYTERGRKGDHSNYRETLIRDPANHADGRTSGRFGGWGVGSQQPINAHDADYWIRYHNNPDEIAVQNVQSDIGQDISKHGSHQLVGGDDGRPVTIQQQMELFRQQRDAMQAELDAGGDSTLGIEIAEIEAEMARLAASQKPASTIAQNDNWKNLLARHVLLQAAESGKPITLPTGKSANAVEGMPVHAATHFYEKDFPDRIAKIAKQYGDGAAGVEITRHAHPEEVQAAPGLPLGGTVRIGDTALHQDDIRAAAQAAHEIGMRHSGLIDHEIMGRPNVAKSTNYHLVNLIGGLQSVMGMRRPTHGTARSIAGKVELLEDLLDPAVSARRTEESGYELELGDGSPLDPALQKDAMALLQRIHLARERGVPNGSVAPVPPSAAPQPRPGTHLNLTPIARRNILDRGMDIMSIAAPITMGALYGLNDDSQKRPVPQDLGNPVSY